MSSIVAILSIHCKDETYLHIKYVCYYRSIFKYETLRFPNITLSNTNVVVVRHIKQQDYLASCRDME